MEAGIEIHGENKKLKDQRKVSIQRARPGGLSTSMQKIRLGRSRDYKKDARLRKVGGRSGNSHG